MFHRNGYLCIILHNGCESFSEGFSYNTSTRMCWSHCAAAAPSGDDVRPSGSALPPSLICRRITWGVPDQDGTQEFPLASRVGWVVKFQGAKQELSVKSRWQLYIIMLRCEIDWRSVVHCPKGNFCVITDNLALENISCSILELTLWFNLKLITLHDFLTILIMYGLETFMRKF